MCFYDANEMACKCWKWGHFRQHCAKEFRTGETCGMKLVMNRYQIAEKCKLCQKIDAKERQIRKEQERIRRWRSEGMRSAPCQQMRYASRSDEDDDNLKGVAEQTESSNADDREELEKLTAEIKSLLEARIQERSQTGIGGIEKHETKAQALTSTTTETSPRPTVVDTRGAIGSSFISDCADQSGGKEVVTSRSPVPPTLFFPIDTGKDAPLIFSWQELALPAIKPLLCDSDDTSLSLTLLRQGKTLDSSEPVVRIQTTKPRSEERQQEIIGSIEKHLSPLPSPRVLFVVGSIKRTARRSDLENLPCMVQNTAFVETTTNGRLHWDRRKCQRHGNSQRIYLYRWDTTCTHSSPSFH